MDWTTAIITLLGSLDVLTIVGLIIYRKENKELKKNEVKVSDVETQMKQIDLAVKFREETLEMFTQIKEFQQQMYEGQTESNGNQKRMLDKLDKLEVEVDNMKTYLDGPYTEWLKAQSKKSKKKGTALCAE